MKSYGLNSNIANEVMPDNGIQELDDKYIDDLTGLRNYKCLQNDLQNLDYKRIYVCSIDANNLKYVNDNFGHESGNELLRTVASAINDTFDTDYKYRTGGDEFVVICEDMMESDMSKMIVNFEKLLSSISLDIPVAAAIGYSGYISSDTSYSDIFKRADKAMYEYKRRYKSKNPEYDMRGENNKKLFPFKNKEEDDKIVGEFVSNKHKEFEKNRLSVGSVIRKTAVYVCLVLVIGVIFVTRGSSIKAYLSENLNVGFLKQTCEDTVSALKTQVDDLKSGFDSYVDDHDNSTETDFSKGREGIATQVLSEKPAHIETE